MRRLAFLAFLLSAAPAVFAQGFDHSLLDAYLKKHVNEQGQINYAAAKQDIAALNQYLEQVNRIGEKDLLGWPQPERTAFWMNVYHAGLLSLILENYPIKSTQDIASFWDRRFIAAGTKISLEAGETRPEDRVSLGQIHRDILAGSIPVDEKIHLALATASKSGPLFPREAYMGLKLLGQMFKKTRAEAARPENVQIDIPAKKVRLSRLLDWYAPDFVIKFNRPERRGKLSKTETAVVNFLIRYQKDAENVKFLKKGDFKIEYLPYNWDLNDSAA